MTIKNMRQLAYICRPGDFDATLDFWEKAVGAGPFYVDNIQPEMQRFNGVGTAGAARIALTYVGQTQIEIIMPTNDALTPWTEVLDSAIDVPRAGLFHHFLIDTDDYDAIRRSLLESGCGIGWEAENRGRRVSYVDGRSLFGCYVELVEWREWYRIAAEIMQKSCLDYDGRFPRRSFAQVVAEAQSATP